MPTNQTANGSLRLFFALWPDRGLQQALARKARQLQAECGGRVMRADGLHMTLLFLGAVDSVRLAQLKTAAARVAGSSFSLRLQRFACWRHNHIGYVAPSDTVEPLSVLVDALCRQVTEAGFAFDRRPFAPHVTVLRKIEHAVATQELSLPEWPVRDFVLVASMTTAAGSRYRVLATWPLRVR